MIVGIGIDMVELSRIRQAILRGDGLARRILTEKEFAIFSRYSEKNKLECLGGRFAAKEAVSKALGTGIGSAISFQQIEILIHESGAPVMNIFSDMLDMQNVHIHLSISHTSVSAIAQVVLEKKDAGKT